MCDGVRFVFFSFSFSFFFSFSFSDFLSFDVFCVFISTLHRCYCGTSLWVEMAAEMPRKHSKRRCVIVHLCVLCVFLCVFVCFFLSFVSSIHRIWRHMDKSFVFRVFSFVRFFVF